MRARRAIREAFATIFRSADAILTYSVYSDAWPADEPFVKRENRGGFSAMVAASNLAELPALFLPVELSDNGLPVGVQLVGPPFSEANAPRHRRGVPGGDGVPPSAAAAAGVGRGELAAGLGDLALDRDLDGERVAEPVGQALGAVLRPQGIAGNRIVGSAFDNARPSLERASPHPELDFGVGTEVAHPMRSSRPPDSR